MDTERERWIEKERDGYRKKEMDTKKKRWTQKNTERNANKREIEKWKQERERERFSSLTEGCNWHKEVYDYRNRERERFLNFTFKNSIGFSV